MFDDSTASTRLVATANSQDQRLSSQSNRDLHTPLTFSAT